MYRILLFIFTLFCLQACQQKTNLCHLEGIIEGMENGEIHIKRAEAEEFKSIKIIKGKFLFEDSITGPTLYFVDMGEDQAKGIAILEPGNQTMTYSEASLPQINIQGSKEHAIYASYFEVCKPYFKSLDSVNLLATQYQDDSIRMSEIESGYEKLSKQMQEAQLNFITNHPAGVATSYMAYDYIQQLEEKKLAVIEPIFQRFAKQNTFYVKKMESLIQVLKATDIGQNAPDFSLPDLTGKVVSLKSYHGKITLLDFWASWCGPCRAENPNVLAAYTKFHSKGFEILAVSLDDKKEKWLEAVKKDKLPWTQVSELKGWNGKVSEMYGIESIPSNFLLDKNGVIIAKNLREEELHQKLESVFGK